MNTLLVPPDVLRMMGDLAGAVNAADSFAEIDPKKSRFYLQNAAKFAAEIRTWMIQVNEAGKRNG